MKETTRNKNDGGFTLVEVLVYMLLLGLAMAAIYSMFISNVRSHASQENTIEMVQDLRGSIDFLVREIRMAGCDPSEANGLGFSNTNDDGNSSHDEKYDTDADSIHFTMDIDDPPDGAAGSSNENVIYYLDGSKIMRSAAAGGGLSPQPIAEKISGLVFQYYDADNAELSPPLSAGDLADIRTVTVTITAETGEVDAITREKKDRVISTRIRVRNAGL